MSKIIWLITFFSFSLTLEAQKVITEYFEGEVTFKVTSKSLDSRLPQSYLDMENGDTMIGKVKRNKYVMYQNSNGQLGQTKMVFLLEKGIGYVAYEKSDTITQFSIKQNPDKLLNKELKTDDRLVILGDTCQSIVFKYIPKINYGMIEYVEAKYYFNQKYKLDSEMYADHEMGFWNEFVRMGEGGISVRNEITHYPLFSTTYEAIRIEEKEISEEEFKIDNSKIIKIEENY